MFYERCFRIVTQGIVVPTYVRVNSSHEHPPPPPGKAQAFEKIGKMPSPAGNFYWQMPSPPSFYNGQMPGLPVRTTKIQKQ